MLATRSARRGALLTRLATSISTVPLRPPRPAEETAGKKARLFYQCRYASISVHVDILLHHVYTVMQSPFVRKRGTLENGILLRCVAGY